MWNKVLGLFSTAGSWLSGIPWIQIGIGAAVITAVVGGYHLITQNATLTQVNTQLQHTIEEQYQTDQKTISDMKNQYAKDTVIIQQSYADKLTSLQSATMKLKDIDNAPNSDDGPVAPVLKHTLDSLRGSGISSHH